MLLLSRSDQTTHPLSGIERLWRLTLGSSGIVVAVIDGPVDQDHPCFAGAQLEGGARGDCSGDGRTPSPCQHGTQIASILFAQHRGAVPVRGVAPRCRGILLTLVGVDVTRHGMPRGASQVDLAQAIDQARQRGASVINVSAGQLTKMGAADAHLAAAIGRCAAAGVLVVAAAGNDGCDCLHVPAALPNVLTVGALDAAGQPAGYSNFGELYQRNGVLAPGDDVPVALPGGRYGVVTGTSAAAALVSGVIALALTYRQQIGNRGTGLLARDLVLAATDPCPRPGAKECRRYLAGRLNVFRLFELLTRGGNAMLDSSSSPSESSPLGSSPPDAPRRADALSVSVPQPSLLAEPPSTGVLPASLPKAELPPQACPEQVPVATVSGARAMVDPASSSPVQAASRISLSGCGCGGGCNGAPQLVFALGSLGYDFGTQARYDAIGEVIGQQPEGTTNPLLLPVITTDQLLALLKTEGMAHYATSIIWTLNIEATPVYAIRPDGPFAHQTYQRLIEFLEDQVNPNVLSERLSVPGYVAGSVRLLSGQSVPIICPELRGMYNWKTAELVQHVAGETPSEKAEQTKKDEYEQRTEGVANFLQRVYFELRNLGQDPRDRALNFAATNAFNVEQTFSRSLARNLELDDITVTPSPVCRQDSDCWDVVLTFFNPADLNVSRRAYRFTVDVSDVVPVLVGLVREWAVR